MKDHKKEVLGLVSAFLAVMIMIAIESFVKPPYAVKSVIKILLFLGTILLYGFYTKQNLKTLIGLRKMKPAKLLYIIMAIAYAGVLVLYFLFRGQLDLSSIRASLMEKEQLTKENCIFVFVYIMVCNSFLEEAFFRGFIYRLFEKTENKKAGYAVSGLTFAVYHIGIVSGWFNPFVLFFSIAGLALVGMTLQFIDEKYGSLKAGWLVHGCANFAINTIGAIIIFTL